MNTVAEQATLVHGYSMADINRIARGAVRRHQRSQSLDYDDRLNAAWHAIVVALYTRTNPPEFRELFIAALDALDVEWNDRRHHYGMTPTGMAPRFGQYWLPIRSGYTDGFSDHLCEKLALRDVLGVLSDVQYEAISALAAFDNNMGEAAHALGMKYQSFAWHVYRARDAAKAAWYDDETPLKRIPNGGETCRVGHPRSEEHGFHLSTTGKWVCRTCKRATNRRTRARQR